MKKVKKKKQEKIHPNCIYSLDDPDLGYLAKAMLVRLAHLDQDMEAVFCSNASLAKDLSISRRGAIKTLSDLEQLGYIRREKEHSSGTKITEIDHARIISKLHEKPKNKRHLAWLKEYYKMPKKQGGRYVV